jgi:hypothetical protein
MLSIGTLSMIEDDDDSSLLPLSDTSKVVLGRYYLAESLLRCVPNRSSIKEPQYGFCKDLLCFSAVDLCNSRQVRL